MSDTATVAAAPAVATPSTPIDTGRQTYTGSCHCGAVRYEAEAEITRVIACNCSFCQKKGTLLAFTDEEDFRLTEGADRIAEYRFNKHVIGHVFCTTCGVEPFARGEKPDGARMVALNVRCLDGVEPDSFPVRHFDGRSR
jgi:hypothetical protein